MIYENILGKALLAVGASEQLVTALSINTGTMKIAGLMIANGNRSVRRTDGAVPAVRGLRMGSGTVVVGLAAVIIGRTVLGRVRFIEHIGDMARSSTDCGGTRDEAGC